MRDVVGVEMGDEEGKDCVEALEGGGEGREVEIVYLFVRYAWDRIGKGCGASEDCDVVVS